MAEIAFKQYGINVYGEVTQIGEEGATIRLQTPLAEQIAFLSGTQAEMIVVSNGPIYMADVKVVEGQGEELVVAFTKPVSKIDRRSSPRRPCSVLARFRKAGEDNQDTLWLDAVTVDISVGGVGLLIEPGLEIPKQVEVRLSLPVDNWPITATARVAHQRRQPDGRYMVGLAFTILARLDEIRLVRFGVEAPPAQAA